MTGKLQTVDLSKDVLPLTLAIGLMVSIAGGIWWASGVSHEQATMSQKLDRVLEIQETVGRNTTAIDSLRTELAAEQYRNEALLQWVITTRLKLAEQGFQTPDVPISGGR